jgi:hypothetical protein
LEDSTFLVEAAEHVQINTALSLQDRMSPSEKFDSVTYNKTQDQDDGSSSACSFDLLWLTQFAKGLFSATSACCYHHMKSTWLKLVADATYNLNKGKSGVSCLY